MIFAYLFASTKDVYMPFFLNFARANLKKKQYLDILSTCLCLASVCQCWQCMASSVP